MKKLLATVALFAVPRAALACPVCFGQSDSPLAKGLNMGVFMMFALIIVVLIAFAAFFVHLMRRARLAAGAPPVARSYVVGTDPQEGTA